MVEARRSLLTRQGICLRCLGFRDTNCRQTECSHCRSSRHNNAVCLLQEEDRILLQRCRTVFLRGAVSRRTRRTTRTLQDRGLRKPYVISICDLVKDRDRSIVIDAKVVPYEMVAPQHRPLVCTFKITPPRLNQVERCGAARIKYRRMKENEAAVISRVRLPTVTTVDATDAIRQAVELNWALRSLDDTKSTSRHGCGRKM
ncbi:unnamed protein product [Heligmosomoides polygyrus]|uniref:Major sperm protein n=1 Tax=Heligmosomoides polygyrus TaxID=6339 RepID=A0A183GTI5_HELPZ|nr:unnamed protein product [Heligmosomoides polygyrus]